MCVWQSFFNIAPLSCRLAKQSPFPVFCFFFLLQFSPGARAHSRGSSRDFQKSRAAAGSDAKSDTAADEGAGVVVIVTFFFFFLTSLIHLAIV